MRSSCILVEPLNVYCNADVGLFRTVSYVKTQFDDTMR